MWSAPFLYCYLGPGEVRVQRRDEAEIRQSEVDHRAMYLIEFRVAQQRHILVKKNVKGDHVPVLRTMAGFGPEGRTVCAYLPAMHANGKCPGFDALGVAPAVDQTSTLRGRDSVSPTDKRTKSDGSSTRGESTAAAAPKARQARAGKEIQLHQDNGPRASASADPIELSDSDSEPEKKKRAPTRPGPVASKTTSASSVPRTDLELMRERSASRPPVVRINNLLGASTLASNVALPDINTLQTISMAPGSYDIRLMVDVREKPGLNNKRLEKMLSEKGVQWASMALSMGDAIWVARDNVTGMEVVLDCVLERKRRDDLEQSLKGEHRMIRRVERVLTICSTDGRYNEQKGRMQASGISRIVSVALRCGSSLSSPGANARPMHADLSDRRAC